MERTGSFIMHAQYFALVNLNLKLFVPKLVESSLLTSLLRMNEAAVLETSVLAVISNYY